MNFFVFLLAQVFFFLKRKSVKKALPKKHFKGLLKVPDSPFQQTPSSRTFQFVYQRAM
jgi:hypothetical protein